MKLSLSAFVLALATATGAVLADEPALSGDLAKLQGAWTGSGGPEKTIKVVVTLKGHDVLLTLTLGDGVDLEMKGEFQIDDTAKPFKTIDFGKFTGANGDAVPSSRAIYDLDGDTLKICSGGPDEDRPTEFKEGVGGPPLIFTLKRVAAAATTRTDERKGDLSKFQGKWSAKVGPEKDIPLVVTFKDAVVTFHITANGTDLEFAGEIKVDETAKPRAVDFIKFNRPDGEAAPDNLAIYEFDGDSLRLCFGGPGNARPTEFKAGEGGPPNLVVFAREKE